MGGEICRGCSSFQKFCHFSPGTEEVRIIGGVPLLGKPEVALNKVVKAIPGQQRSPLHGQGHGLLLLDRYKGYGELMRNVFEEP